LLDQFQSIACFYQFAGYGAHGRNQNIVPFQAVHLESSGCLEPVLRQFSADHAEKPAPAILICGKKNSHSLFSLKQWIFLNVLLLGKLISRT
jgi:hypothetical protein